MTPLARLVVELGWHVAVVGLAFRPVARMLVRSRVFRIVVLTVLVAGMVWHAVATGLFVNLQTALRPFEMPSAGMRSEAASAGFYDSPWGKHPRLQLLTVAELLAGKGIDYPRVQGANVTYKKAQPAKISMGDQLDLVAEGEPDKPYDAPDPN